MADLAPPPRSLPANLRRKVAFGGIGQQVGWIIVVIGLIVALPVSGCIDVSSMWKFRGSIDTSHGVVTAETWTNTKVNGQHIRKVSYQFTDPDGAERGDTSYGLGVNYHKGESVTVEFPHGDPGFSRIRGMRRKELPGFVIFFFGIPLAVGLVIALIGNARSRRAVGLLRHGVSVPGRLVAREPTNMRVNGQSMWRMKFEFQAADGRTYAAIAKTLEPHRLMDQATEPVLYDPKHPDHAVMLDALPGAPKVDGSGQLSSEGPAFSYVMAPLLAVSLVVVFIVITFLT